MPRELKPNVLYVSEEFDIAIHLCPCGCGSRVKTPLGAAEWSMEENESGPTLEPSLGNWQIACQSHYWITRGNVEWAAKWKPEQIAEGRRYEEKRRRAYYEANDRQRGGPLQRFWWWLKDLSRH
jgi:Family of unknown function (DUF6527)